MIAPHLLHFIVFFPPLFGNSKPQSGQNLFPTGIAA
jgi:hypothetical protein